MTREEIEKSPEHRWLMAYEPTDAQIKKAFAEVPSAKVIITPTKKIWRDEFFGK